MGQGGFDGSSLALFTVLTPAGAVAFACFALFLLASPSLEDAEHARLGHCSAVALIVAWTGFIASATHLGTPANALHVAAGIGRSPLSNEVAATVAFLFAAGMTWMYSYRSAYRRAVANALYAASLATAVILLAFTSQAYSVPTIPSWDTWLTPATILSLAASTGSSLAVFTLKTAERTPCKANAVEGCTSLRSVLRDHSVSQVRSKPPKSRTYPVRQVGAHGSMRSWPAVLLAISTVALIASSALLVMHAHYLTDVSNNVATASALADSYGACIALRAALSVLGFLCQAYSLTERLPRGKSLILNAIGCILVLAAALVARAPFYEAYLTAGF